jgi:hypothetical protein
MPTPRRFTLPENPPVNTQNFKLWEDEDALKLPELSDIPSYEVEGVLPEPARLPSWNRQQLNASMDDYEKHVGAMPRGDDKQYQGGTLSKILAAAVGGASGYLNAGGKMRIDPQQTGQTVDNLLRPGYARAREAWEDEDAALRTKIGLSEKQLQLDNRDLATEADMQRARAADRTARANEEWRRSQAAAAAAPKRQALMNLGAQGVFDPELQRIIPGTAAPEKPEVAQITPYQMEQLALDARRIRVAERPEAPPRGATATPAQSRVVESTKQSRLMDAEQGYRARIANSPTDAAAALADLNNEKQQIQNAYEAEIAAQGGSPDHFEYGATPPAVAPPASATVRVMRPDGVSGTIPRANLQAALAAGAKLIQ